jgi:hypothetical protein
MFQATAQAARRANVDCFISAPSFELAFYREVTKS